MKKNKVIMTESKLYDLIENTVINVLKETKKGKQVNEGARADFIKGAFERANKDEHSPKNNEDSSFSWSTFIQGKPNRAKYNHAMASRNIPGKREHYTNVAGLTEPGLKGKLTRTAAAGASIAGAFKKRKSDDAIKEAVSKSIQELVESKSSSINEDYYREGWTTNSLYDEVRDEVDMIMNGQSWRKPFRNKMEVKEWVLDRLPNDRKAAVSVTKLICNDYGIR